MKGLAVALMFASLMCAACAEVERPRPSATTSHSMLQNALARVRTSQVYYDGAYGHLISGYWGPDNTFYFSTRGPAHRRDAAHHIRRQPADGFRSTRVPDLLHAMQEAQASARPRG